MNKNSFSLLETGAFVKKLEAEVLLLKNHKNQHKQALKSALTAAISNVNFKEPKEKLTFRYITFRYIIGRLLRLPIIGWCLRKTKKCTYDLWKNRQIKQGVL